MTDDDDDFPSFTPDWQQSGAGNWWCKATKGWRITVYLDKHDRWKYMFCLGQDKPLWGRTQHQDVTEAKTTAVKMYDARL
jgi:hypothetical protein